MITGIKQPKELNGETGLIAAVISTAVVDAMGSDKDYRADAWRYFASEAYTHHLDILGLPIRLLPKAIEDLANEAT